MTEGFIRLGHRVAGCGRSANAINALNDSYPASHRFDVVDVSIASEVRRWATLVLDDFGTPDLLINNAALMNRNARLWELDAREINQLIDVNIKGVIHVIQAFLPSMIERGSGVIVNFSSYWGRSTSPEVAPYCASKWAIEGLTRSLGSELPPGLAAVPVNPGVIDTPMLRSCFGSAAASYLQPMEWAEAAVPFLLSLGPAENGKPVTVPGQ